MKLLTACAALVLLAGCANQNAANDVAATEVTLTGALEAALVYQNLPRCPQPTPVCSDQATVNQIKAASKTAYDAVKAAKANPTLNGAAQAAVQALVASIPKQGGSP